MKPSLFMVGNFLSEVTGVRGVCEDLAERLTSRGWDIVKTSNKVPRGRRMIDMLAKGLLTRHRYDVAQVDVYSGPAFFWAEAMAQELRLLRCPFVLTLHGGNLPSFAARHKTRVKRLLQSAAVVTSPSAYLREEMGQFRADIRLIPNGLDVDAYTPRELEQASPRLVWLRAFHAIYNPVLAVETVARLRTAFPDVQFQMVGPDKKDGSYEATLDRVKSLGLDGTVKISGAVGKREVPKVLETGDIFLNTTDVDNTPVTVLEAMATGLCVVSTSVGGIPYLLEDGVEALLVPPRDPNAMAAAVERILRQPQLARSLSENGRKRVHEFAWDIVVPRWEELLTAVAASGA
jgi:glycosyltransferase involved in cell wall biosynthesis